MAIDKMRRFYDRPENWTEYCVHFHKLPAHAIIINTSNNDCSLAAGFGSEMCVEFSDRAVRPYWWSSWLLACAGV